MSELDRRTFLRLAAALPAAAMVPAPASAATADRLGDVLPKRTLGRSGLEVTAMAMGGGMPSRDFTHIQRIIDTAIAGGIRFFETARQYANGRAEAQWGKHLTPRYRDDIVLLSKSLGHNAQTYTRDLETSLRDLKTDYLDIHLIHSVSNPQDVDERLAEGVYDAALKAKAQGKVRVIGFSGHADHRAHAHLIAKKLPELDIVLLPTNPMDPVQASGYISDVIPAALDQDMGVIGMKVLGGGSVFGTPVPWSPSKNLRRGVDRPRLVPDVMSLDEVVAFSLSLPVGAITFGNETAEILSENIAAVKAYTGMTQDQRVDLVHRIAATVAQHPYEHYKASARG
ncbi:MAG: aldo/keto reductase [Planctomycetota bacterium]